MRRAIFAVGILAITTGVWSEKKPPPVGILAASAGESVVLADPLNRWSKSFDIGTVGWLFQAPGGVLFAPDLVRGKTTVLDLRGRRIVDHIEGVTMPHFGPSPDRYFVAAGDILVVSYPDRAIISRIAAEIGHPRQVIPASDTVVLVLEWSPDGSPKSILSAIDLPSRQVVFRRPLAGDVRSCSLSS